MDTTHDQAWAAGDAMDPMIAQEIDFSNLLDLTDMDVANFAMQDPDPSATAHFHMQHPVQPFHNQSPMVPQGTASHDFAPNGNGWDLAMGMSAAQDMVNAHAASHENMQALHQLEQQLWDDRQEHAHMDGQVGGIYRQPQQIPPTPNSYELQGASRFVDGQSNGQQRAFLQQQIQHQLQLQHAKRDNFTPLVSPAVTPQESTFRNLQHQFAPPAAYFSPLTSPALEGQPHPARYATNPSTAVASAATSPAVNDVDVDMLLTDGAPTPERTRKPIKKAPTSRSVASRSLRQSPIVKAQKRKSGALNSAAVQQELQDIIQDGQVPSIPNRTKAYLTDDSGHGSISPEPLDSVMGPPPRPGSGSVTQSPILYAQMQNSARSRNVGEPPATPASLMAMDSTARNPNSKVPIGSTKSNPNPSHDNSILDGFTLPPSAAHSVSMPATPMLDSSSSTPRMTPARKTPKLNPLSTATTGRSSATSSPAILAMASPSTAGASAKGRVTKKRGSVNGAPQLISPALRPKISPSIKPLFPEGGFSDSQHALLLASKSNYTNLLEGTLLPGVSYPDSLSSGLTSKRTSHKIAEQGRRNRINEALKEMQALLPPPAQRSKSISGSTDPNKDNKDASPTDADAEAEKDGDADDEPAAAPAKATECKTPGKAGTKAKDSPKPSAASSAAAEAKAANSKAATVESAIEYIKILQQEKSRLSAAMEARDEEVNDLRRRLRDAEFRLGKADSAGSASTGSASSPGAP